MPSLRPGVLTQYEAHVRVPGFVIPNTVEHVMSLQETVQRAEHHSRHHDEQRTRPAFIHQRVDERPEKTGIRGIRAKDRERGMFSYNSTSFSSYLINYRENLKRK